MEVGAVKQAFNNELILLKKKLNQAKIQIIHKLTRKAKTFAEKKAPEKIKEKFKRKAESAVNEVLIIKKIKPKDLARFIVTHKGELNSYLNKPNVDQDKACARLLLHKSLQDKYKSIRNKFSTVPIEDLLMSREERKKLKKEAREKQKNKKKGKGENKVVNAAGDWDVEDVDMPEVEKKIEGKDNDLCSDDDISEDAQSSDEDNNENEQSDEPEENSDINGNKSEEDEDVNEIVGDESDSESNEDDAIVADVASEEGSNGEEEHTKDLGKSLKPSGKNTVEPKIFSPKVLEVKTKPLPKDFKKIEKVKKDKNKQDKNKNLNEKMLLRKFKKDVSETRVNETKVVDPFFITSTGENYMSVVEPRQPDEIKEEHVQGNRKLRRAAMFGHVPKIKPRSDDFGPDNRFSKNNDNFNKNNNGFNKNDGFKKFTNSDKRSFTDKRSNFNRDRQDEAKQVKEEKLHPSWEAKKKQSGILPFQGKKIVFDES